MITKIIHSDDYTDTDVIDLIDLQTRNNDHKENYDVNDWQNNSASLLYILIKQQRFLKAHGGLVSVYNDREIVGISGFNRSDFDNNIFIGGVRTLIDRPYRNNYYLSKYLTPIQLECAKNLGAKMFIYTFDVDNHSSLYNIYVKNRINLFLKNNVFNQYDNIRAVEYPVKINNCLQNVLYTILDDNYEYDWTRLR